MTPKVSADFAKDSNLEPNTVGFIFFSQLIATALHDYEAILKTSFVFFLEEEKGIKDGIRSKMTFSKFIRRLKQISPSHGDALDKIVDKDLRNSLAHGTYWFDKDKVFLAKNSYLDEVEQLSLAEFWKRTRRINIISHAFIETLMEKVKAGYFKV